MFKQKINDRTLLERVLEHEDELPDENAVNAFRGMKIRFGDKGLSRSQREWVALVYKEKDIQRHYSENLVSKGKVPRGKKMKKLWWEKKENHPLKPPGVTQ